jgi:hypothetical protein
VYDDGTQSWLPLAYLQNSLPPKELDCLLNWRHPPKKQRKRKKADAEEPNDDTAVDETNSHDNRARKKGNKKNKNEEGDEVERIVGHNDCDAPKRWYRVLWKKRGKNGRKQVARLNDSFSHQCLSRVVDPYHLACIYSLLFCVLIVRRDS